MNYKTTKQQLTTENTESVDIMDKSDGLDRGGPGRVGILGQTDPTQIPVIRLRFSSVESWAEETVVEIHPTNLRHQNLL